LNDPYRYSIATVSIAASKAKQDDGWSFKGGSCSHLTLSIRSQPPSWTKAILLFFCRIDTFQSRNDHRKEEPATSSELGFEEPQQQQAGAVSVSLFGPSLSAFSTASSSFSA
jgi:hypothetical protein